MISHIGSRSGQRVPPTYLRGIFNCVSWRYFKKAADTSKPKPAVKMSGGPESEADSLEVNTILLPNGNPRLINYLLLGDGDGHKLTVAESLLQALQSQQAANAIPRIRRPNGSEIEMDRNREMIEYLHELMDGTLLLY